MRIGIIMPDRGDRPAFYDHADCLIKNQTANNKHFIIHNMIDYPPESEACDITERYRLGYDIFREKNLDIIFLMESDDWYSPNYIDIMIQRWVSHGKPDLMGIDHTIYYHIG